MSQEERGFAEDMEIGTYAFKYKNYRGAELRFRHALEYKPGHPDATFKLAESLNKLGKNDEAKQMYQAYLGSQPNGLYAERARTALQRLSKLSAEKN
jgi:TolA-binding protein